jgi:hypothetical protein
MKDHPWFCIAGIWRSHPEIGEAFTMLTMEPGEDVAPYHSVRSSRYRATGGPTGLIPRYQQRRCGLLPKGSLLPLGLSTGRGAKRRCFEVSGRRELDIRRVHIDPESSKILVARILHLGI